MCPDRERTLILGWALLTEWFIRTRTEKSAPLELLAIISLDQETHFTAIMSNNGWKEILFRILI